jgi:hypothetical protein
MGPLLGKRPTGQQEAETAKPLELGQEEVAELQVIAGHAASRHAVPFLNAVRGQKVAPIPPAVRRRLKSAVGPIIEHGLQHTAEGPRVRRDTSAWLMAYV